MVGLLGNGWQSVTLDHVLEALRRHEIPEQKADMVVADLIARPKNLPADAIRHTAACHEFGIDSALLSTWTKRKRVRVYHRRHREVWLSRDDIAERYAEWRLRTQKDNGDQQAA